MMKNILLVGPPRVGKTTVVQKVLSLVKTRCGGFFTQAADKAAFYTNFRLVTVDGPNRDIPESDLIRRFDIPSLLGFNVEDLENRGRGSISKALETCDVVVIDQLGTLEAASAVFRTLVSQVLDSSRICLATMGLSHDPFLVGIRNREDVTIMDVCLANRSTLAEEVSARIRGLLPRKR